MLYKYMVPVPKRDHGITFKKIKNGTYVYYDSSYRYNPDTKTRSPQSKSIGKCVDESREQMYPNSNYEKYFPDEAKKQDEIREDREIAESKQIGSYVHQEWCVKIGNFIMIDRIITLLHLDVILKNVLGNLYYPALDFISYMIITRSNTTWGFEEYACENALFNPDMRILSDSTLSRKIHSITENMAQHFLSEWTKIQDHRHKVFMCYDSSNFNCDAGDVELADYGNAKDDLSKPIVNLAVAYDLTNKRPVLYQCYNGAIPDISQVESLTEALFHYYFRHIGFIFDRGYFSYPNIKYLDDHGFDFLIMVKGKKKLVNSLVDKVHGTFEDSERNYIYEYETFATTVRAPLCKEDIKNNKQRYFHIYFSSSKANYERRNLLKNIDDFKLEVKKHIGEKYTLTPAMAPFFVPVYDKNTKVLLVCPLNEEEITRQIQRCGYFSIISQEIKDPHRALILYKGRDCNEKIFMIDKSMLGNSASHVHSDESVMAKALLSFIALIVRNELYVLLQDFQIKHERKRTNHLTPAGAIKTLEHLKIARNDKYNYWVTNALTRNMKDIFEAIGLDIQAVTDKVNEISAILKAAAQKDPRTSVFNANDG